MRIATRTPHKLGRPGDVLLHYYPVDQAEREPKPPPPSAPGPLIIGEPLAFLSARGPHAARWLPEALHP